MRIYSRYLTLSPLLAFVAAPACVDLHAPANAPETDGPNILETRADGAVVLDSTLVLYAGEYGLSDERDLPETLTYELDTCRHGACDRAWVARLGQGAEAWWQTSVRGVEQGWTLRGDGPARGLAFFDTVIEGATSLKTHGNDATFTVRQRLWRVTELNAWDADGKSLDATMVAVNDETLRVQVRLDGARWPVTIDPLYTRAGWMYEGFRSETLGRDGLGQHACDFNADGYDDVFFTRPYGGTYGEVDIYYGSSAGVDGSTTVISSTASTGVDDGVACAGDINGDTYDDLVVGDRLAGSGRGALRFFPGSASGLLSSAVSSLSGTGSTYLYYGHRVHSLGDTNGDGYGDILIVAPTSSYYVSNVFIHRGTATGVSSTATMSTSVTSSAGAAATALPDIDGDGANDFAIGKCEGQVDVFLSHSGTFATSADQSIYGPSLAAFGCTLSPAGDLDGDGYDDMLVGAYNYRVGSTSYGRVYRYSGTSTGFNTSSPATIDGSVVDGAFGYRLAGNGDVDGDGNDDIVVGATYDSTADWRAGAVYTYHGNGTGLASTPNVILGTRNGEFFTRSGVVLGDYDGDGISDLLTGSDYAGPSNNGQVIVYYAHATAASADADGDGAPTAHDCDDSNREAYIGAIEVVNDGIDEDCDGEEDCYADVDGDGYGYEYATVGSFDMDCTDPGESGLVGDCDDTNASTYTGAAETPADGRDSDCDHAELCYQDGDGDGYGGASTVETRDDYECTSPGEASTAADCNDTDAAVAPAAVETAGDGVDQDCDGREQCYVDTDGDGVGGTTTTLSTDDDCLDPGESARSDDCDDTRSDVFPGSAEVVGDGVDQDCNGHETCRVDADSDNYGSSTLLISADLDCADPGESTVATDCDDTRAAVHPGATEVCDTLDTDEDCNGVSDDLDSAVDVSTYVAAYRDRDGDLAGDPATEVHLACAVLAGWVASGGDCEDLDASRHPAAQEVCDAADVDEDCDGRTDDDDPRVSPTSWLSWYRDADSDGWGDATRLVRQCEPVTGYVNVAGDCDDTSAARAPDATELCDEMDNDCDSLVDEDAVDAPEWYHDLDGDSHAGNDESVRNCTAPAGAFAVADDCDDTDRSIHPDAPEVCNRIDDDCNELIDDDALDSEEYYRDSDLDGHGNAEDVLSVCTAPDGYVIIGDDCNDDRASTYPDATEYCGGGDQNCDGQGDNGAVDARVYYWDGDGDGHAAQGAATSLACAPESNFVEVYDDCDDANAVVFPGAEETCDDHLDGDCDGDVDEDCAEFDEWGTYMGCATGTFNVPNGDALLGTIAVCLLASRRRRKLKAPSV